MHIPWDLLRVYGQHKRHKKGGTNDGTHQEDRWRKETGKEYKPTAEMREIARTMNDTGHQDWEMKDLAGLTEYEKISTMASLGTDKIWEQTK